jgi:hypothetical protein
MTFKMRILSIAAVALALLVPTAVAADSPLPAPKKKFTLMPAETKSDVRLGDQALIVRIRAHAIDAV